MESIWSRYGVDMESIWGRYGVQIVDVDMDGYGWIPYLMDRWMDGWIDRWMGSRSPVLGYGSGYGLI